VKGINLKKKIIYFTGTFFTLKCKLKIFNDNIKPNGCCKFEFVLTTVKELENFMHVRVFTCCI
jgi:hypothetical protein